MRNLDKEWAIPRMFSFKFKKNSFQSIHFPITHAIQHYLRTSIEKRPDGEAEEI
jgi:hypothetical protein